MMNVFLNLVARLVLMAAFLAPPAVAQCPPGSVQVGTREEVQRDGVIVVHPQCKRSPPNPSNQSTAELKVAADVLVPPGHLDYLKGELAALEDRKQRLAAQRDKVIRVRGQNDEYLRELAIMRDRLMYDGLSDVVSVVGSKTVLKTLGLSTAHVEEFSRYSGELRGMIDTVAVEAEPDSAERARKKAYAAASAELSAVAAMTSPPKAKEALSKSVRVAMSGLEIIGRYSDESHKTKPREIADDMAGLVAIFSVPVAVTRTAINTLGDGYTYYRVRSDMSAIEEALVSSQRAYLAVDKRLAETDEAIRFYEAEIEKYK